ncbi:MAG: RNA methyltransferase [Planctomycetota bacterium]|nr:RNA methyltransferase [Planctomycetota bacterium]
MTGLAPTGPTFVPISGLTDPAIDDYRNLREIHKRKLAEGVAGMAQADPRGLVVAEGEGVIRPMLDAGVRVKSVLATDDKLPQIADILARLAPGTPVYTAPEALVQEIAGFPFHRGVLSVAYRPLPRDVREVLRDSHTAVVLEDVYNVDNVGGMFRNAAALGGPGVCVICAGGTCDPLYRKAIRVSMGKVFFVPWTKVERIDAQMFREAGFETWALTPAADARPIGTMRAGDGRKVALLLGSEGPGLRAQTQAQADARVTIPIWPGADSLNVFVAGAIALSRVMEMRAG